MEEARHDGQRTEQKKADLEELWAINTAQELQNSGMLRYHDAIRSLREKPQEDCDRRGNNQVPRNTIQSQSHNNIYSQGP